MATQRVRGLEWERATWRKRVALPAQARNERPWGAASVRAVAEASLRTRALGDGLEVNGGARSRALGCASTAAHVAWPRRVGPASAATTSHPWRPSRRSGTADADAKPSMLRVCLALRL